MSWYSRFAQFAVDGFEDEGRDSRQTGGPDLDSIMFSDDGSGEPEFRRFETVSPLLAIPSRLETGAVDRVYAAFDVSQPVAAPEDLRGRDPEVKVLLSGVLHRRNHGLISGPRGSGKTSLVRVFGQYADREGIVVLYSACDSATSFGEMVRSYLEQIPTSMLDPGSIDLFEQRVLSFGAESSAYQATGLLAMLKYSQLVIVLDEFDRITDPAMHDKVSSLLKLVSDARLPVRFVLVGGNSAFADIVRNHPSLMRHMTRVSTAPLSSVAIFELLERCATGCGIQFTGAANALIDEIACGSPYHARLFGMHGALNALSENATEVQSRHVERGLENSFNEWSELNPADAQAFREIIEGTHGPPKGLIDFARQVARHNADDDFAADWKIQRREIGEKPAGLSQLSQTIQVVDGRPSFRDATAPQFLLALAHSQRKVRSHVRGGKHA